MNALRRVGVIATISTLNFDGSEQTNISNDANFFSESGPAWSADGDKLLVVRQPPGSFPGESEGPPPVPAGGSIWIRSLDEAGPARQITVGPNDANPAMSPNGRRIAFSRPGAGGRHL